MNDAIVYPIVQAENLSFTLTSPSPSPLMPNQAASGELFSGHAPFPRSLLDQDTILSILDPAPAP